MGMFKHRRVMAAASAVAAAAGIMLLPATAVASPMRSTNVVLSTTAGAQGSWRVCNHLNEKVDVAIAYVNPHGGFISEGWWPLEARGACATVMVRSQTSDPRNVFIRVQNTRGTAVVDGTDRFCAKDDDAFTIIGNRNCAGRGYESRTYQHRTINLDATPWTTHLRGEAGGVIDDNN
jgi:uncharacterized membrane protein